MTNDKKSKHTNESQNTGTVKKRRWPRVLATILIIILVLALAIVLFVDSLFVRPDLPDSSSTPPSPTVTPDSQPESPAPTEEVVTEPIPDNGRKSEDFYTILLLGRDTGGGGNTDTILLASYDVTNQKATIMSIPRDTMVNVPWDVKKINSVYPWYGGGERGIERLYQEISQLVGFQPDYRIIVDWEAVGDIVDAIGGVWFDVPYNMDYDDPAQDLSIHQEAGYRYLTGEDAMQVIRWRKNNRNSEYGHSKGIGDAGRMKLQQDFLQALIEQLVQPENLPRINKLAKVFQDNVDTDLTLQNILWFGQQAIVGGLSTDNINFTIMPFTGAYVWSRNLNANLAYVLPVQDELLELVNNELSPFREEFTLSDLDIMFVNDDGSLSSSSGHVEDEKSTYPKSYWTSNKDDSNED